VRSRFLESKGGAHLNLQSRANHSTIAAIQHIPELDGIRGTAILLVLFYHLHVPLFDIGWCGVDLFFVLSGFLITSILLNTKGSPSYFSSFYARRMLRIFPLYFSFLFAYFCVLIPIAHHFGRAEGFTTAGQFWYWFYLQNWWNGVGHDIPWLSHLWSLAVEEQFYLVWPLLVLLLSRRALAYFSVISVVVCLLLRVIFVQLHALPELVHRATVFRIDTLALGGALAVLVARGTRDTHLKYPALWGVVLLGIGLHWVPAESMQILTVGYTGIAIASAYLVFHAVTNTGSSEYVCRLLRNRLLRRFGKYSYGMYVLHLPIVRSLSTLREAVLDHLGYVPGTLAYGGVTWFTILLGCFASYGAALLSWHLIEKHFLRLKWKFGYDLRQTVETRPHRKI
jgi:peptidoglycan/LPS O-acetylase OafA/YrhL